MQVPDATAARVGWVLIAAGLLFVLCGLSAIRTGRVTQGRRHRLGFPQDFDVEREHSPVQFWLLVVLCFLVGSALVGYGIGKLLNR